MIDITLKQMLCVVVLFYLKCPRFPIHDLTLCTATPTLGNIDLIVTLTFFY